MTIARIHDDRVCQLGEGPLWHPIRNQLFWFDILSKKMLCDDGSEWIFDDKVSAAGWISESELLIASERELFRFDMETGERETVVALEADNPNNRSNDGRIDPWGGFWIGTLGYEHETGAGAIYRYYKGELRKLFGQVTIPNAICFDPDGTTGFFGDTTPAKVWKVRLDERDGWPVGDADLFLDLKAEGLHPDGAVILQDGSFLNAQYHASRVALYDAAGVFQKAFACPASRITCPAMNGTLLFATSACAGQDADEWANEPHGGKTFSMDIGLAGQLENQVIL